MTCKSCPAGLSELFLFRCNDSFSHGSYSAGMSLCICAIFCSLSLALLTNPYLWLSRVRTQGGRIGKADRKTLAYLFHWYSHKLELSSREFLYICSLQQVSNIQAFSATTFRPSRRFFWEQLESFHASSLLHNAPQTCLCDFVPVNF